MATNCGLLTKEFRDLTTGIEVWAESQKSKSLYNDPFEAAMKMVRTNFSMDLKHLRYVEDLTPGQVKSFLARLKELTTNVEGGNLDNNFAKLFYQTSHYGPKDPVVGNLLNDMQQSQFKFNANEVQDRTIIKTIHTALREVARDRGFQKSGLAKSEKASKELDNQYLDAMAEWKTAEKNQDTAGRKAAEEKMSNIKDRSDRLTRDSHLQVYNDMIEIIEIGMPEGIKEKFQQLKKEAYTPNKDGKQGKVLNKKKAKLLGDIVSGEKVLKLDSNDIGKYLKQPDGSPLTPNMYRAVASYVDLMDRMYYTLKNGVNKRIDSVIQRMSYLNKIDSNDVDGLNKIKKSMREKYMPDYETGFFPHYVRDLNAPFMNGLMKSFDDLQLASNSHTKKNNKSIREVVADMNLYINKHAKPQVKDRKTGKFGYDYSRNFFNSVDNYVTDVNRFNYISFMDSYMLDGLTSVERIYKTEGASKGYADNLVDFISDMHRATNGDSNISDKTRAWMRTMLGFEFISKIGANPRAAARNAFQRLLDYVTWGPVQIGKAKDYLKSISLGGDNIKGENYIDEILKKNGLLFEEVSPEFLDSQLKSPASAFKLIEWNNETNKFEAVKKLRIEKVADGISTIAGKSSFLHRKAENSNRKHTFKVGYSQMHKWLNTAQYRTKLAEEGKSTSQSEAVIRKAAENYAVRMVIMNHFDYSEYAKSRAFRTKPGKFFGQFQHYSFEFFERNMKIAREAKYDVLAGKLMPGKDAQGLAQAYRLSFAYFLAPVLASVFTGVDFGNLVEHDTAQRLKQWSTLLLGDEEQVQEAFYGKGPIISTFGGPITSDILEIGQMLDLIDLSEPSILTLITGLEGHDPYANSSDISKKLRILNTFAGRAYERHLPQLRKGRIGWALQQELGLYPTAQSRKAQKKIDKATKKILPPEIERALKQLQQSR
jgi:hypothetical protein